MRMSEGIKKYAQKNGKKHNSKKAVKAKIEMRRNILSWIGGYSSVFDAYGGNGMMYREAWSGCSKYTGCDIELKMDGRKMFCADNIRVLRSIDLSQFNIFDLDAFGSPWEQAAIVAKRRKISGGEKIGLCLTIGDGMNVKFGGMPTALSVLAGFRTKIPGGMQQRGEIIDMAINTLCETMNVDIDHRWQAESKSASAMIYVALALIGKGQ